MASSIAVLAHEICSNCHALEVGKTARDLGERGVFLAAESVIAVGFRMAVLHAR